MIRYLVADSAVGPLLIAGTERGLCWIGFDLDASALRPRFPAADIAADDGTIADWAQRALAVIAGERDDLPPLDAGGTPFQQRVWDQLRQIPRGETRSYAEIAAALGVPGAIRAVGRANGANPLAVLVPCHRVVRSDGSLGGYAGGLDIKRRLLEFEGARFAQQARLDL